MFISSHFNGSWGTCCSFLFLRIPFTGFAEVEEVEEEVEEEEVEELPLAVAASQLMTAVTFHLFIIPW